MSLTRDLYFLRLSPPMSSIHSLPRDPLQPRKVPSSDTLGQNMTTPQRRSVQDLQILIDELFEKVATTNEDGVATCRVADLPKVLAGFEERRQIALLDEDERGSLEAFAEQVCVCARPVGQRARRGCDYIEVHLWTDSFTPTCVYTP